MCLPHHSSPSTTTEPADNNAMTLMKSLSCPPTLERRNHRKRVRFESETPSPNGAADRSSSSSLGATLPVCGTKRPRAMGSSESGVKGRNDAERLTEDEKSALWFRGAERAEIHRCLSREAHESRICDNKMILLGQPHFCFRDTYANVFAACHLIVGHDDDDMCSIVSPEIFTFMATNDARGLEDRTAPRVALERRLLRARQTQLVLQAQRANHDAESVRNVSRALSRPSRKLAEALGIIDATAAMMTYTNQNENDHHHLCEPELVAPPFAAMECSPTPSLEYCDRSATPTLLLEGRVAAAY